jgi:hypothetical protein
MREVTKDQFFAIVNPMDVVLRSERDATFWETRSRQIVGKSTPGYSCRDTEGRYTEQKQWFLN